MGLRKKILVPEFAQRIIPEVRFEDLVISTRKKNQLREIVNYVLERPKVYEKGDVKRVNANGFGVSALFAGPSGTGKAMAAEALAKKLDLPMFRIDLSQIVNKYIGEIEKNLMRLFDVAEISDSILFFDEADALFGRRTEVKDAHDRYANINGSYLL